MTGYFVPNTSRFSLFLIANASGSADGTSAPGESLESTADGVASASFTIDNSDGTTSLRFAVGGVIGTLEYDVLAQKFTSNMSEQADAFVKIWYELYDSEDNELIDSSDPVFFTYAFVNTPFRISSIINTITVLLIIGLKRFPGDPLTC